MRLRRSPWRERFNGYHIEMAQDVPNARIGQWRKAAEHKVDIVEVTSLGGGTRAFLGRFLVVVRSGSGEGIKASVVKVMNAT